MGIIHKKEEEDQTNHGVPQAVGGPARISGAAPATSTSSPSARPSLLAGGSQQ